MLSSDESLKHAIRDYLLWMEAEGYRHARIENDKDTLDQFLRFVQSEKYGWDEIFTLETLKSFQERYGSAHASVRGLSRYLFDQKRIRRPIEMNWRWLPEIYEEYLTYHEKRKQVPYPQINNIRGVIAALHDYLKRNEIDLSLLEIEHIDAFLVEFFEPFMPATCRVYRSKLRGFLKYLYQERQIIKRDLAVLVTSRRSYSQAKPPKFLRPQEIQRLFSTLKLSIPANIRTYAMIQLAYCLGLRPFEITRITLDDISFRKRELLVKTRKGNNPMTLPVPDHTIKSIAAYLIKVRSKSKHRTLFLTLYTPHRPISPNVVGYCIGKCMRQADLPSTPYWLRHTYAQNLIESGTPIFEIKEMMGHDKIESTKNYLHIHIKMMRKVLFHEEL
jgi:integrase/recombinase XerD